MRASDIATSLVVLDRGTPATKAVRLIAERDLLGLVIAEDGERPSEVVSSLDVVRFMLPGYLLDDLSLANTLGEAGVEDLFEALSGRTIGDLVDDETVTVRPVLVVPPDAGLVEVAARMADAGTQVALIGGRSRSEPSFVTLPAVLDGLVRCWDEAGHDGSEPRA